MVEGVAHLKEEFSYPVFFLVRGVGSMFKDLDEIENIESCLAEISEYSSFLSDEVFQLVCKDRNRNIYISEYRYFIQRWSVIRLKIGEKV